MAAQFENKKKSCIEQKKKKKKSNDAWVCVEAVGSGCLLMYVRTVSRIEYSVPFLFIQ
jgi:hypothetical protein